ncbi:hypothetical protein BDB01DRAFT_78400 [Pilobolus umbonatus]|nr:hypothetical protein BDB01DRAFT_78400 [Pilobolus umbonatus]
MMLSILIVYSVLCSFELMVTLLIQYTTWKKPRRIMYAVSIFSLFTLPASLVNVLTYAEIIDQCWNSLTYCISTAFMLSMHFWLNLDIGQRIRPKGVQYSHPLIILGILCLLCTLSCFVANMTLMFTNNEQYPHKIIFLVGVCVSILADCITYFYAFSGLINMKKDRFHESQSKTTAIGIWYLFIQLLWYTVYGIVYVWFFCKTWEHFITLLVMDYSLRFVLCVMFMWAPPTCVIECMAKKISVVQTEKSINGLAESSATNPMYVDKKNPLF